MVHFQLTRSRISCQMLGTSVVYCCSSPQVWDLMAIWPVATRTTRTGACTWVRNRVLIKEALAHFYLIHELNWASRESTRSHLIPQVQEVTEQGRERHCLEMKAQMPMRLQQQVGKSVFALAPVMIGLWGLDCSMLVCFWDRASLYRLNWHRLYSITQFGLKLITALLLHPSECWGYKIQSSCLTFDFRF